MTLPVDKSSVAHRLTEEIGGSRVVAAFFSSFTFRSEFFERVALPVVTLEGRRRGLLPITVVVDRTQFQGAGWGYEVVRAPGGRRWHAKLVAVMTKDDNECRTVLAIGSGNLTRSGWERNLELFHVDSWSGWHLPGAVLSWLRTPWLRESAFARWSKDSGVNGISRHHQSVVESTAAPLVFQTELFRKGRQWSELHVVSPFGDADDDEREAAASAGPFFNQVLGHAASKEARLTVYLRGADEAGTKGYGYPSLLKRVSKKVRLNIRVVPSGNGRLLHAKLFAAKAHGKWSILVGSPNSTGAAFVTPNRNIELACEFRNVGKTLPRGLLPVSQAIKLTAVVQPEMPKPKRRWECLSSASYSRARKRLTLHWINGHGPADSRVLLEERDLASDNVDLSSVRDRFLKTIPRGSTKLQYEPDFVPIEVPIDEEDLFEDSLGSVITAEDWLSRLGFAEIADEDQENRRLRGVARRRTTAGQRAQPFQWREQVLVLRQRLRGLEHALAEVHSKREIHHLRKVSSEVWRTHDPDEPGLTVELRAWRTWVRAGLWQVLNDLDHRRALVRPLSSLVAQWGRKLPGTHKEFRIA